MNGKKIFGMVSAVALMVFMIAPIASAQINAGILDDQWFKVTVSLKGYKMDGETVLGQGTMKGTVYLLLTYKSDTYTVTTCTQDDYNDTEWHLKPDKNEGGNTISLNNIYGAVYPEVWDFGGNPILFFNGTNTFNVYPTLYMKITADGPTLKKATISTVSCAVWADLEKDIGDYITGSCTLSGSTIAATQVTKKVPAGCLLGLP